MMLPRPTGSWSDSEANSPPPTAVSFCSETSTDDDDSCQQHRNGVQSARQHFQFPPPSLEGEEGRAEMRKEQIGSIADRAADPISGDESAPEQEGRLTSSGCYINYATLDILRDEQPFDAPVVRQSCMNLPCASQSPALTHNVQYSAHPSDGTHHAGHNPTCKEQSSAADFPSFIDARRAVSYMRNTATHSAKRTTTINTARSSQRGTTPANATNRPHMAFGTDGPMSQTQCLSAVVLSVDGDHFCQSLGDQMSCSCSVRQLSPSFEHSFELPSEDSNGMNTEFRSQCPGKANSNPLRLDLTNDLVRRDSCETSAAIRRDSCETDSCDSHLTHSFYDVFRRSPVCKRLRDDYYFAFPSNEEKRKIRALYCAIFTVVLLVLALVFLNVAVPYLLNFDVATDSNLDTNSNAYRNPTLKTGDRLALLRASYYANTNTRHHPLEKSISNNKAPISKAFVTTTPAPRVLLITGSSDDISGNEIHDKDYTITAQITALQTQATSTKHPANIGSTTTEDPKPSTWLPVFGPDVQCADKQFRCSNGGVSRIPCLWQWERCDGVQDCSDGSDERFCDKLRCYGNFQCASKDECVSLTRVCNGLTDCQDGSDEQGCDEWECHDYEFRCSTGYCIPKEFLCDGDTDCPQMEDEANCTTECSPVEFLCPEGHCIPDRHRCNGVADCLNGEDEHGDACNCDDNTDHAFLRCEHGRCVPGLRCDGVPDCDDGSDEWDCVSLAEDGSLQISDPESGNQVSVCADNWTDDMSDQICQQFGSERSTGTLFLNLNDRWRDSNETYRLKPAYETWTTRAKVLTSFTKQPVSRCLSSTSVTIRCQSFECGIWNPTPSIRAPDEPRDTSPHRARRMLGGHSSAAHQWPSVVLLYHPGKRWLCTASLVAPGWLITSALCVKRTDPSTSAWRVVAGNAQPNETRVNADTRRVAGFVEHSSYRLHTMLADYDIMLVKLDRSLDLTSSPAKGTLYNVGAICLPERETQPGDYCLTAGWGFTTPGGYFVNTHLHHLQMDVTPKSECNSPQHYNGMLTARMMCAVNEAEGHGPCSNDEGAPLMCHDSARGRWYLAGVLTSHNCGAKQHPAVYADVYSLNTWIRQTIFGRNH